MNRIGYVLFTNERMNVPSTRISALNMFEPLRRRGFLPFILYQPEEAYSSSNLDGIVDAAVRLGLGETDIVYFQKVFGPKAVQVANELKKKKIKTVFGICDAVEPEMVDACDATIVPCDALKQLYPGSLHGKIRYVPDGIERPDYFKRDYSKHWATGDNPLKAVILTSERMDKVPFLRNLPEWIRLTVIGNYGTGSSLGSRISRKGRMLMREPNAADIVKYAEKLLDHAQTYAKSKVVGLFRPGPKFERVTWNIDTVFEKLAEMDVGLIPVDFNSVPRNSHLHARKVKSANKLTQLMSIGLPVIASPVPAYLGIVEEGVNGYIARSLSEWDNYFKELRDGKRGEEIGRAARRCVMDEFSQENQARLLASVLESLISDGTEIDQSLELTLIDA